MGFGIYPAIPAIEDTSTFRTHAGWSWNLGDVAISPPYLFPWGLYAFAPGILIQPVIQAFPYDISSGRKMGATGTNRQSDIDDLRAGIKAADQLFLTPDIYSGYWILHGASGEHYGFGFVDYPQGISGYEWFETSLCSSPGSEWQFIELSAVLNFPYQLPIPRWDLFSVPRLDFWRLEWYWKEPISWRWCLRWRPVASDRKSGLIPILTGGGLLAALAMMVDGVMVAPSPLSKDMFPVKIRRAAFGT